MLEWTADGKFFLKHPGCSRNKYYIGNTMMFVFTHQLLLFPTGSCFLKGWQRTLLLSYRSSLASCIGSVAFSFGTLDFSFISCSVYITMDFLSRIFSTGWQWSSTLCNFKQCIFLLWIIGLSFCMCVVGGFFLTLCTTECLSNWHAKFMNDS